MFQAIKRFIPITTLLLTVLGVVWLNLKGCGKPTENETQLQLGNLKESEEVLQVQVRNNYINVRTNSESQTSYIPEDSTARVTINKQGEVALDIKTTGFRARPVVGALITDGINGALGINVFYWNRWEGYIGMTAPSLAGFVGVGYKLDQIKLLSNTSAYVAYTTRREVGGGILVRF